MDDSSDQAAKQAIALRYEEGDAAPRVIASGAGELAQRILELAKQHNIPIRRDEGLADLLSRLNLGYEIPPETYQAVAEILSFLYWTDEQWRAEKDRSGSPIAKHARRAEQNISLGGAPDSPPLTGQTAELGTEAGDAPTTGQGLLDLLKPR